MELDAADVKFLQKIIAQGDCFRLTCSVCPLNRISECGRNYQENVQGAKDLLTKHFFDRPQNRTAASVPRIEGDLRSINDAFIAEYFAEQQQNETDSSSPHIEEALRILKNARTSGLEISTNKDGEICYPMLSGSLQASIDMAIESLERLQK